ncbi:MAG TPA: L-threonylcarbamoyladenylate synthase [Limnochordia bacterium]|nr:L-threonylcarbamoyladenylate synthase [Limnochordia bacterium]
MAGLITELLLPGQLDRAAELLSQGEIVAFPTETVYGLGANALDPLAVAKIFQAKGRPQDNPLIVHCTGVEQVEGLVREIPPQALLLMDRFWPGPLTLVLKKGEIIPEVVTAGLDTVAVRVPDHPVALALLQAVSFPLAAPSANLSGRPSPTRAEHVLQDLQGRIPAVLDGGETGWGVESTVLDCTEYPFRLLRPGGVTLEELRELVPVSFGAAEPGEEPPRSPGMKYAHYAPQAEVFLVSGPTAADKIQELSESFLAKGQKVGVLTWDERARLYPGLTVLSMGPEGDLPGLASRLYHLLRRADELGLEVLFAEGVPEERLGLAIMNRLRKAAKGREIIT